MKKYSSFITLMFIILMRCAFAASPPDQPASGPGSSSYVHAAVSKHEYGSGPTRYWIYEPSNPKPQSAPLIIFNHGWGAINPKTYGAWIEHIVRRGNIVVYPVYQENLRTSVADFLPNALSSVKDALRVLQEPGHVKPMLEKFAIVGHSMGGLISADMAAVAAQEGLPQPRVVMCVEPGKTWAKNERVAYHLHDLTAIPPGTLLLTVSGDADKVVSDKDAKRIFNESTSVLPENKNYIIVVSDSHGTPPLKASHFAPVAPDEKFDSGESLKSSEEEKEDQGKRMRSKIKERLKERVKEHIAERREPEEEESRLETAGGNIDALDYYAYWKLFDALCNAAFYGKDKEYALGNTSLQRYMGVWSDGVPVKELVVISE